MIGEAFRGLAVVIAAGVVFAGCAHRPDTLVPGQEIGWPPDQPRVRLEAIIDLHPDPSTYSRKITGWAGLGGAGHGLIRPYGVEWLGDRIVVTDPDGGRVAIVSPSEKIRFSKAGVLGQPIDVSRCLGGLVVSDAARGGLVLLDEDLELLEWLATDLDRPTGVTCLGDRIAVVETGSHRVLTFDQSGSLESFGSRGADRGQFNFPTAIANHRGVLVVGDTLNFRVQLLDPQTGVVKHLFGSLGDAAGDMPRTKDVESDSWGRIWVTDAHLDTVSIYDDSGTLLLSIGGHGVEPGMFSFPAGVATDSNGRVVVVDSFNRRLQVFRSIEDKLTASDGS